MSKEENIDDLIKNNRLGEAALALEGLIATDPSDAEAWYLRGKVAWRMGERSRAVTCYEHAAGLDSSSPAVIALEQARDIEAFFNHDLLNP